jgi:hypothetical protein
MLGPLVVDHSFQSISWLLSWLPEFFKHLRDILAGMRGLAPIDGGPLVFDNITHLWGISAWVSVVLRSGSPVCAATFYRGERHHGLLVHKLLWLLVRRSIYLGVRVDAFEILFCINEAIMVILIFGELYDSAHDMHNLLLIGTNLLMECSIDLTHFFLGFAFHDFLCKDFLELNEFGLQVHAYQVQLVTFHCVAHLGVYILVNKWAYSISPRCSSLVEILLLDKRKLNEIPQVAVQLAFAFRWLLFLCFIQQRFINLCFLFLLFYLFLYIRLPENLLQVLI